MLKLNKTEQTQKAALIESPRVARAALELAADQHNRTVSESFAWLQTYASAYNDAARKLADFAAERAAEASDYFEDKSEKWQESEAGEQCAQWRDAWESFRIDEVEFEEPKELDAPNFEDELADLQDLPDAPE